MELLRVTGGRPLAGSLEIQGAKNSVLPLLAATILGRGVSVLRNCPRLTDVDASLAILEHLGCKTGWDGDTVWVDATELTACAIPDALMRAMRSSVIFLGPILGRLGQAAIGYPGGCELGPRPIDLHLDALRTLGAAVEECPEGLRCTAPRLRQGEIDLPLPSVGATENAILAAVAAPGVTVIRSAAQEPEIVELQTFLRSMGAQVSGAGSSTVVIRGGAPLHGGEITVMGDRIVCATYLCGCAAAGGEIELTGVDPRHVASVTALLAQSGCQIAGEGLTIRLRRDPDTPLLAAPRVHTAPYPGFPTDAQAPLMAALCTARGTAVFVENIFASRYRHIDELTRMGACIRAEGRVAVVTGVERLHGAAVEAFDLRGGAALAVAALGAEGESVISGLRHIRRGYAHLSQDLAALGARADIIEKE